MDPVGGQLTEGDTVEVVDRAPAVTPSIEVGAVMVAGGSGGFSDIKLTVLLQEALRHCKALAAWANGADVWTAAGVGVTAPRVSVAESVSKNFTAELIAAVGLHRAWARADLIMNS